MPKVLIRALRALSVSAGLAAAISPAALTAQNLFAPAITVNGDVVSRYELNQREQFLRLLGAPSDPAKLAQDQLIEDRLKFQAANEYGVTVSPEDLRAGMEEFAGRANLSSDEFVGRLSEAGVSEQTFRDFVQVGVLWRDVVRGRFLSQARPSDAEIDRAMGAGGRGGLRVLLSEIVMPLTPENQDAVRARAEEIAQIKSIDAFSAQAREVSATNTRDQGGRMDWVALNDLPPALRPAILALSPGDVTPPLQLPNAVALFQLRDIGEITGKSTSYSAIDYAMYFIPGGRTAEALSAGQQIANSVDTCDDFYGLAKGQPAGTLQRQSQAPAQIPSDVAVELAKLDPGETSLALTRNNGQSLMLLMLCGRTATANEDASREQVANALTAQRLEAYASSYLDQLKANAMIKVE
ncbi:MAG: peptidylprolyl isomerase [Rhodobacteraceae bacterium]|nr:peptidylprolyl isomerase [Paracoccaceae bacterium]MAY46520.1 peptidylprolyl isomerase [Paracoccaceae bacterium]